MVAQAIDTRLPSAGGRPLMVGLCGAQGSGKSTLASGLVGYFGQRGVRTALLSIDDLYLTQQERRVLARDVHPLLRTRGVPGTHDIALGLTVCDRITGQCITPLPRFDKARDDRRPFEEWEEAPAGTRLLILEGWCVGARAQAPFALIEPINDLERLDDPDGIWRGYANAMLAGPYQQLFSQMDMLVLLAAPDFSVVRRWRTQQETALRARSDGGMTDEEIVRFIAHYERLTRHILAEMPARADLLLSLDEDRRIQSTERH